MTHLGQFYARLGITPGASLEKIRQAYADTERKFHADRFSDDPLVRRKAQEQLSAVNEAYLALVDAYMEVQASLAGPARPDVTPAESGPPETRPATALPGAPPPGEEGTSVTGPKERPGADGSPGAPENGAAAEHKDDTDPACHLKREIARLLAILAALVAIVAVARYRSGRTSPGRPAPGATSVERVQTDVAEIRRAAEQGNTKAQALMGYISMEGRGVPKDMAEAARWFGSAAEHGDAESQDWLGYLYETGQGAPQDYREAARWYRMAAEQGNADAQKNLGLLYANGKGVVKDSQEALKWLKKAADQGNAEAVRVVQSRQVR